MVIVPFPLFVSAKIALLSFLPNFFKKIFYVQILLQNNVRVKVLLLICYDFLCTRKNMKKITEITSEETFSVRSPVLREGLPIESCVFDGDNLTSTKHFGLFVDEKLTAIVSVFKNNNSTFNHENQFQIRGMAVLKEFQKLGFGKELLLHCEQFFKYKNGTLIWFNARETAALFYEKLGYEKIGNLFNIESVGLHYIMKKEFAAEVYE